ncbi:MAG: hypothetical protein WCG80_02110 [Spirochaetales bacterium]
MKLVRTYLGRGQYHWSINGWTVTGQMMPDEACTICGRRPMVYQGEHDNSWCPACNRWGSRACNDPTCGYCRDLPALPMPALLSRDSPEPAQVDLEFPDRSLQNFWKVEGKAGVTFLQGMVVHVPHASPRFPDGKGFTDEIKGILHRVRFSVDDAYGAPYLRPTALRFASEEPSALKISFHRRLIFRGGVEIPGTVERLRRLMGIVYGALDVRLQPTIPDCEPPLVLTIDADFEPVLLKKES